MRTAIGRIYHFYAGVFHEWPPLLLVNFTVFLAEIAYFMTFGTLPLYLTGTLHAPTAAVGFVFAAFAIVETASKTPCGVISDRWGRMRMILLGLVLCICAPLLMARLGRWEPFLPVRILDGLGLAAVWPTLIVLITLRVKSRNSATALSTFNLAYIAGMGLGWMGGLEIGQITGDNQHVFYYSAIMYALALVSAVALLLADKRWRRSQVAEEHVVPAPILAGLRELARTQPCILHMLWIFVLVQVGTTMLAPILPLYARDDLGLSQHGMVQLLLLPVIIIAALAVPLGRLADWAGRDRAVLWGLAIGGVAMLGVPFFHEPWQKQAAIALLGCCYAAAGPAWLALTGDMAPTALRGTVIGAMNTAQGVGFVLGPILGTILYEHTSVRAPFVAAAILVIAAAIAVGFLVKDPGRKAGVCLR
jgi:MFS transporter, DHA1 family, multidrug resistance protein